MEDIKIAGVHTVKQWKELDSILDTNDNKNWALAFSFFEERIETRYLKPIEAILNMKDNIGEGFAVVNVQCSLIETIESFIQGWKYKNKDTLQEIKKGWYVGGEKVPKITSNDEIFKSFFENREPFKKMFEEKKLKGNDFYKNVRCGLLHETQTKNGWKIKVSKKDNEESITDNKTIYRENFQRDIKKVIENYKSAIIEGKDFDEITSIKLRQNFRDKFNHICEESKEK